MVPADWAGDHGFAGPGRQSPDHSAGGGCPKPLLRGHRWRAGVGTAQAALLEQFQAEADVME
eukprot:8668219-Alexandrium_andersonii.AAC.1